MIGTFTRVFATPGKYIQGPGKLKQLTDHASGFGDSVFALVDKNVLSHLRTVGMGCKQELCDKKLLFRERT
jgi:hypothetical protein